MALRRSKVGDVAITELDLGDGVVEAQKKGTTKPAKKPAWLSKANTNLELHDFRKEYRALPFAEFLERFGKVLAFYYRDDPTIAGLHLASLARGAEGPIVYYAAVHRYGGAQGTSKQVVVTARGERLQDTLLHLADIWLEYIRYVDNTPAQGDLIDLLCKSLEMKKEP